MEATRVVCSRVHARGVLVVHERTHGQEAENCDFAARPRLLCKSLGVLRAELHQSQVATIGKVWGDRQRRNNVKNATERLVKQNPLWQKCAAAEQWSAMRRLSASSLVSMMSRAGRLGASATDLSALAAVRKNKAEVPERAEATALHQELLKLLKELVGEQKHDLHKERFPLTPEGLFDQIWQAVLVRGDLEQSL